MRYPAAEKVEIIRLVEASHLPARRTLEKLGIPRATFYRWYDRYRDSGPEALGDRRSRPDRVWNRIPEAIRDEIIDLALALPELSPRELAVRFTDEKKYFVSAWLCTSGWPAGDEHEAVEQVGWDFLHLSAARRGSESHRCPQLAPDQGEGVAESGIVFRVPADAVR
jgi:transposase-like protein